MDSPMRNACAMIGLAVLLLGCAADRTPSTPSAMGMMADSDAEAGRCVPLETKVTFSCWSSGTSSPMTHCVAYSEDKPHCGLKQRAGAYLSRGAPGIMRDNDTSGGWLLMQIFADAEGRIGMVATKTDGTRFLHHHDQSPPPNGAVTSPNWPRWPPGLEFGPEQLRR